MIQFTFVYSPHFGPFRYLVVIPSLPPRSSLEHPWGPVLGPPLSSPVTSTSRDPRVQGPPHQTRLALSIRHASTACQLRITCQQSAAQHN